MTLLHVIMQFHVLKSHNLVFGNLFLSKIIYAIDRTGNSVDLISHHIYVSAA